MAPRSGLSAQLGIAEEVTPGTAVTVTKFVPLVSESLSQARERLESEGIIAGRRFLTSDQWNGGNVTVGGDTALEVLNRGIGIVFKAMLGSVSTTGAGPYTHTITPGDLKTYTLQVGRPDVSGTVNPFTYAGNMVDSWEIAVAAGELATLGVTWVGMSETTGTALATASYPTGMKPLKFNHASVTIGGSAANVRSMTISGTNGVASDRRFLGSQSIAAPLEADRREVTGSIELEFESLTQYERFVDGDEAAVVLAFDNGTDSVTITMNARFDGETPQVGGREILTQAMPFKAVASGADSTAISVELVNSDATI